MKRYTSRFSLDDKMRESKASREEIERRRRLMEEYEGWAAELKKRFRQDKSLRLQLRNGKRLSRMLVDVAETRVGLTFIIEIIAAWLPLGIRQLELDIEVVMYVHLVSFHQAVSHYSNFLCACMYMNTVR